MEPDMVIGNADNSRHGGDGDGCGLVTSKELLSYVSEIAAGMVGGCGHILVGVAIV